MAIARLGISRAFYRVLTLLLLVRLCSPGVAGCVSLSPCVLGLLACSTRRLCASSALRAGAQTFELVDGLRDEWMGEGHLRGHALVCFPFNAFLKQNSKHKVLTKNISETRCTYVYEVYEIDILRVDHFAEVFGTWHTQLALAIWHDNWAVVFVEENLPAGGPGKY